MVSTWKVFGVFGGKRDKSLISWEQFQSNKLYKMDMLAAHDGFERRCRVFVRIKLLMRQLATDQILSRGNIEDLGAIPE